MNRAVIEQAGVRWLVQGENARVLGNKGRCRWEVKVGDRGHGCV
jgi:hypothetical protein